MCERTSQQVFDESVCYVLERPVEVTPRPVQQKYTALAMSRADWSVGFIANVRVERQCKRLPPLW